METFLIESQITLLLWKFLSLKFDTRTFIRIIISQCYKFESFPRFFADMKLILLNGLVSNDVNSVLIGSLDLDFVVGLSFEITARGGLGV